MDTPTLVQSDVFSHTRTSHISGDEARLQRSQARMLIPYLNSTPEYNWHSPTMMLCYRWRESMMCVGVEGGGRERRERG